MTPGAEEADRLHPGNRAEWRAWLTERHRGSDGVWLVFWRRQSGRTGLSYEEAIQEALCFGWIDGKAAKLDDQRTMLRFLVVPDDLAAAFADRPGAREHWDGFPRSVRRAALAWIVEAKRPDTRARRVSETARRAARGERPG